MINLQSKDEPALSDASDAELVRHIQSKSTEKCKGEIDVLYKRYAEDVFRTTRSLYDYSEEGIKNAEDLFQEAWRLAIERMDRYDPTLRKSFGAWVKGIADNLFLEDYRLNSKKGKVFKDIGYLMPLGEDGEPIDENQSLDKSEEVDDSDSSNKKLIQKESL